MRLADVVRVERDGELALVIVNNPPVNTITADVREDCAGRWTSSRQPISKRLFCCAKAARSSPVPISASSAGRRARKEYRRDLQRLRSTDRPRRRRDARHRDGRRSRDCARMSLPGRCAGNAVRHAGSHARHHSRCGRYAAHAAPDRRRRRRSDSFFPHVRSTLRKRYPWDSSMHIVEGDLRAERYRVCARADCAEQAAAAHRRNESRSRERDGRSIRARKEQARKLYPNRNGGDVAVEVVARRRRRCRSRKDSSTKRSASTSARSSPESKGAVHAFFAERETREFPACRDDAQARAGANPPASSARARWAAVLRSVSRMQAFR